MIETLKHPCGAKGSFVLDAQGIHSFVHVYIMLVA